MVISEGADDTQKSRGLGGEVAGWPYPLPAGGTRRRFMWDPLSFCEFSEAMERDIHYVTWKLDSLWRVQTICILESSMYKWKTFSSFTRVDCYCLYNYTFSQKGMSRVFRWLPSLTHNLAAPLTSICLFFFFYWSEIAVTIYFQNGCNYHWWFLYDFRVHLSTT